jgi:hypothetical protein
VINAHCRLRVRWRVRVALWSSRIRRFYESLEIEDTCSRNIVDRRRRSDRTIDYDRHIHDNEPVDIVGRIDVDRHEQQQRE